MDKLELIECDGVSEQLAQQRPEYQKFYETWKRVYTKSGHKVMTEYFPRDNPTNYTCPDENPDNRVCTLGSFEGPHLNEKFRVHYRIKDDGRVYILEVGINLGIDKIKY